jgi:hypothetical protein
VLVGVLVDPFSSGAVHGGHNQLGGSLKPQGVVCTGGNSRAPLLLG